jgi:hypothetical protein
MKLLKSVVGSIGVFFVAVSKASRAAELARTHRYDEARALIER